MYIEAVNTVVVAGCFVIYTSYFLKLTSTKLPCVVPYMALKIIKIVVTVITMNKWYTYNFAQLVLHHHIITMVKLHRGTNLFS